MHDDASMPESALRLFIGLQPDDDVQAAIRSHQSLWRWPPRARLLKPEHFHMTLHFWEQVHPALVDELQRVLGTVPMQPIPMVFRSTALWKKAAVLLAEENAALNDLRCRLMVPLMRMGLRVEGHWTPHVTLARQPSDAVPPASFPPVHWTACHFALVRSTLSPRPPHVRHDVLPLSR
jgi:2'-5' RNA ligase